MPKKEINMASKYNGKIKSMRANGGGRRKKFDNNHNSSPKWLKARHRIKHRLAGK